MLAQLPKILNYGRPINWNAPLNRGLVGWWMTLPQQPARAKGIFRNLVGKNHAVCGSTIAVSSLRPLTTNVSGTSLKFDGTTNSVAEVSGSDYSFGAGNFSFGGWLNPSTGPQFSISTRSTATTQGFEIVPDTSSSRGLRLGTSVGNYTTTVPTTANEWQHLFATVDVVAGSSKCFVNGVLKETLAIAGTITNTQTLRFGQRNVSVYTGLLNDIRIYSRALSNDMVLRLYRASRTGYRMELNWLDNNPWSVYATDSPGANRRRRVLLTGAN